jgi:uncharacterized protein involved in exopolysaccharide biosynthesis
VPADALEVRVEDRPVRDESRVTTMPGWATFTVTALAVLLGVGGWALTRPVAYTSSAVVALTPKATQPVTAAVVTLAAPRYVAYGTSPYVLRMVAAPLGLDSIELQNGIVVTMAAATANISIAVTLRDPQLAARAADAVAAEVLKRTGSDPILDAQMVSNAVPASAPAGPDPAAVLGFGGVGALLAGAGAGTGLGRYRRRRASIVRGVAAVVPAGGAAKLPERADLTRELPAYRP